MYAIRSYYVFRKLENKLSESNHIIYYYQPDYSTSAKNFKGIIYDIENRNNFV